MRRALSEMAAIARWCYERAVAFVYACPNARCAVPRRHSDAYDVAMHMKCTSRCRHMRYAAHASSYAIAFHYLLLRYYFMLSLRIVFAIRFTTSITPPAFGYADIDIFMPHHVSLLIRYADYYSLLSHCFHISSAHHIATIFLPFS